MYGNKNMFYIGYILTPEGIETGRDKLDTVKWLVEPTKIKMVLSLIGLCNFFKTHI